MILQRMGRANRIGQEERLYPPHVRGLLVPVCKEDHPKTITTLLPLTAYFSSG
jgi:hypothetical protein